MMYKNKWTAALLAAALLLSLALTACQSGGTGGGTSGQDRPSQSDGGSGGSGGGNRDESGSGGEEPPAPPAAAHWSIDQAIENHMRFSCLQTYSLYAEGTVLYASNNSATEKGNLSYYAKLAASGEASPTVRQLEVESYRESAFILDSDGKLWSAFLKRQIFPEYSIRYFSCPNTNTVSSKTPQVMAAVTDGGQVIWDDAQKLSSPKLQEGLENVKYVAAGLNIIAYVREDGTAGWCRPGKENHELEGWSGIAFVVLCGGDAVLGLRQDGTVAAQAIEDSGFRPPEELSSWSDVVYLTYARNSVLGLRPDGSVVCALMDDADDYVQEYTSETVGSWENVMVLAWDGAITADHALYEYAQKLIYAWDLTQPWENNDAALRDYVEEKHNKSTDRLAELD